MTMLNIILALVCVSTLVAVAGSRCPSLGHRGLQSAVSRVSRSAVPQAVHLRTVAMSAAYYLPSVRSTAIEGKYVSRGCGLPVSRSGRSRPAWRGLAR